MKSNQTKPTISSKYTQSVLKINQNSNMHIRKPPHWLAATSLLAILIMSPFLMVPTSKAEEFITHNDSSGDNKLINGPAERASSPMIDHDNQQQQELMSRSVDYPRQLFRLHILDSRPSSRITRQSNNSGSIPSQDNSNSTETKQVHKPKSSIKNISNATLKKLLTQAMQQQQNRLTNLTLISATKHSIFPSSHRSRPQKLSLPSQGTSESNSSEQANQIGSSQTHASLPDRHRVGSGAFLAKPTGGNFKFVFIQRAASNGSSTANNNNNDKTKSEGLSGVSTASPSGPSLAASISKQLASSLLYSAANLVNNLNFTSQTPSLSDLKSQLASKNSLTSTATTSQMNDNKHDESSNDLQRVTTSTDDTKDESKLSEKATTVPWTSKSTTTATSNTSTSPTKKPKFRKNSKIYNLPVKFVSNGQPSQIVIQTIKQHLAAMRRMQQVSSQDQSKSYQGGMVRHANERTESPFNGNTKTKKIKGSNSRLIYLPLKLLINGKASRISVSNNRVSHHQHHHHSNSDRNDHNREPNAVSGTSKE